MLKLALDVFLNLLNEKLFNNLNKNMEKSTEKKFGYFWLFCGLVWAGAGIRHLVVKEDITGAVIEFVALVFCLVLAYKFFSSCKGE